MSLDDPKVVPMPTLEYLHNGGTFFGNGELVRFAFRNVHFFCTSLLDRRFTARSLQARCKLIGVHRNLIASSLKAH